MSKVCFEPAKAEVFGGFSSQVAANPDFELVVLMLLPNEDDRKRASKAWPAIGSAFFGSNSIQSAADKALLGQVMNNMFTILVKDEELREKWWSFVMRNRIETGNFLVGVSMMSIGGTLGNGVGSCIPSPQRKIAMPLIGAGFGLAAGIGASFVPKETKDSVTRGLQSARIRQAEANLSETERDLAMGVAGNNFDKAIFNGLGLGKTKLYQADVNHNNEKLDSDIKKLKDSETK